MLRSILTPVACSLLMALSAATGCSPQTGGIDEEGEFETETHYRAMPCSPDAEELPCTRDNGEEGVQHCVLFEGEEVLTECLDVQPCYPGDHVGWECGTTYCMYDTVNNRLYTEDETISPCDTPLVVNFERAPLTFEPVNYAASFDISGVGECLSTDWPTLPWLALDRDRDGTIDSGKELFGSGTVLASGQRASQGFQALAELDHNHDGVINAQDPAFADLVLWSDLDGDRRGSLTEQTPVTSTELEAIHLDARNGNECDNRGNCGGLVSTFEFRSASGERRQGEIVDVFLPCR